MASIEEINRLNKEVEQEGRIKKEEIAQAIQKLKNTSLADLVILKSYWESEKGNHRKFDDISTKRRMHACNMIEAIKTLLSNPKQAKTPELVEPSVKAVVTSDNLKLSEAAIYLTISKSKLYKMTSLKEIPHRKVGQRLVFSKAELDEYLIGQRSTTSKEIDEKAESMLADREMNKKLKTKKK